MTFPQSMNCGQTPTNQIEAEMLFIFPNQTLVPFTSCLAPGVRVRVGVTLGENMASTPP